MPEPIACPDCGRAISLNPSGWWSHDHAVNPTDPDCWRVSLDGPVIDGEEDD